jgi:hypothetical protein
MDIPSPDSPIYDEYIKVCMFLYVYYIIGIYYAQQEVEPNIADIPLVTHFIINYIHGRISSENMLESYKRKAPMLPFELLAHETRRRISPRIRVESSGSNRVPLIPLELLRHATHIRQFFKDTTLDFSRINIVDYTYFGSIQHFGEQVMAMHPDEYFLAHIDLSRSEEGHGVIIRNFKDSSMIIQNSWGDIPKPISTTLLNMGVWGDNPLESSKWGFLECFVYVGYEDIQYEKKGLKPLDTFKKNYHTMLTGMTLLACIMAVYLAYTQSFKGKMKTKRKTKRKKYKGKV